MPKDTIYGFPKDDWERAHDEAKDYILRCAKQRRTTTYSELCEAVTAVRLKPRSWAMKAFLNRICTEEDAEHGVMLASLVVRKDTGMPGDGYFGHADTLGRETAERRAFWEREVERIYEAFAGEE